ncbi:hypothetical protein FD754_018666 [Muntiacus muntjak]|uniref:MHD1 domain-containing protein n=1 Tax=Muntiacus muntjak TaxID=9888 RepID=A0A5N3UZ83_MUNMU|nr:hypothetical protein FD754_018666 [Muntiacus muntjak]
MPISRRMDKEAVVHIHHGILLIIILQQIKINGRKKVVFPLIVKNHTIATGSMSLLSEINERVLGEIRRIKTKKQQLIDAHILEEDKTDEQSRNKNNSKKYNKRNIFRVQLFATPWTVAHPGSSVRGLLQAKILEWVAMPSSRGSSQPRDRTQVSHILYCLSYQGSPRILEWYSILYVYCIYCIYSKKMICLTVGKENMGSEGMAVRSSTLVWRIPRAEEPGGLLSMGHKESDRTEQLSIWKIYCYGLYQRVFCLCFPLKVSQYTFAMCSYREKKSEPQELMQLEGYTVDYTDPHPGLQGGHMFFNAVKEGDTVIFASDDEQDRILWVQAMYRATGQSYKPVPAIQAQKLNPKGGSLHADAQFSGKDADRFQKHGMDEFISANPCKLDHAFLFRILQRQTLDHRLNDSYSCLGWFSPGQVFVLDEYCARYGVRGCHRHLCYLTELMEHSENGAVIDPTLLHYSFAFCASHVHGNRYFYLQTHSEMWRVLMKDIATPIPAEEVKKVVRKCLEKAALINYTRLTEYAKIEETMNQATPARKLEEVLHLAELCIEVLQQNEEHHAEAFAWWPDLLAEHAEKFWALFTVDMDTALEAQPQDSWDSFPLFQLLNNFLRNDVIAYGGPFPRCLFLYRNIANSLPNVALPKVPSLPLNLPQIPSFSTPSWMASLYESTNGSATSEDLFWKLDALQMFVFDLHWPEQEFAHHLEQRLKLMASDMIEACVKRTRTAFELKLQKASKTTDLRIPASMCTMFNVLVDAKKQSTKLCALDGGQEFVSVLEGVLSKLSRYDEGTFFSSILSFTVKAAAKYVDVPKPGMDLADTYIMFVRQNQDILREKVNEEMYIEKLFDKTYRDFRLQGVLEGTLNSKTYDTLHRRLTVEEATASVSEGGGLQGITMKDSDEEEEG